MHYDEKCDVWSVGCVFYELLTNHVLFIGDKEKYTNSIRAQIAEIIAKVGEIPKSMIKKSCKRNKLFRNNYLPKEFAESSIQNYKSDIIKLDIPKKDLVLDFLSGTIQIDPRERWSIKKCLRHQLFD